MRAEKLVTPGFSKVVIRKFQEESATTLIPIPYHNAPLLTF